MMVSAENDPRKAGTIWMLDLDQPAPIVMPRIAATFRRVGLESLSTLAETMSGCTSMEILRRLETGERCYTAWVEGKLAAYGWISFDHEYVGELNLRVRLLPGEAYIWDCATLPVYRRNRLYSALLSYIIGELQAEQLCRVWIGASRENMASQRGIANAGFHMIADMTVARVFAMRLVWVQGRPGVPEHLVAEARRAFLDNRDQTWLAALKEVRKSPK